MGSVKFGCSVGFRCAKSKRLSGVGTCFIRGWTKDNAPAGIWKRRL